MGAPATTAAPLSPTRAGALLAATGAVAFLHAALTWPAPPVAVLFGGGGAAALVAEATAVRAGLLVHRIPWRVAGVPLPVVVTWPASVYVTLRVVALVTGYDAFGVAVTAVVATLANAVHDPRGVAAGYWRYPPVAVSRLRYRGIPWWNAAGWASFTAAAAGAAVVTL